jgi:ABC-type transport system involved in multi-copper enzyme maturation permease subunit
MSFITKIHTNLFIKAIKKDRWLLIGLFAGIFITVFVLGMTFPADNPTQLQGFDELLENPIWQVFLGSLVSLSSLQGWFAMGWFSASWWIGIPLALYLGIQIFTNEIAQGTADHLLTAPVSRREVLVVHYVSAALELLMMPLSTFLGISLTFLLLNIDFPILDTISVITLDYVFFLTAMTLTLFFSLILVEIKRSLLLTGVFYVFSYFFQVVGSLNPDLEILRSISIFETRPVIEIFVTSATEKILPNVGILIVLSSLFFILSFFIIERVEIRKR